MRANLCTDWDNRSGANSVQTLATTLLLVGHAIGRQLANQNLGDICEIFVIQDGCKMGLG